MKVQSRGIYGGEENPGNEKKIIIICSTQISSDLKKGHGVW
jgi:hypothetical protein